ncbi:putative Ig domain-containing protein [Rudanella paleaurantiibacter]|uniref:putative Ig domain-containing protein n=1 Tax=Rudanella paleaurantiibacter TaxID=2614655 RepID=UPI001628D8C2|nr:putative Ig domain-containing protein [Rudanella paleaurantiibacter]
MTVPRVASTQLINVTNASGYALTPSSFTVTRTNTTLTYSLVTNNFAGIDVGTEAAPTVVDFDQDGRLDLFVGQDDGTVSRYEQTAVNGTVFTNLGSLSDGNGTIDMGGRVTVSVVDTDGDGKFSVLLGRSDGLVHEYEQTTIGSSQLVLVTTSFGGVGTTSFAVVGMTDFSGEGRLEFLTGKGDGIVGYFNQSDVNSPDFFRVNSDYLTLTSNTAPFCVDLDGNGRIDVLMGVGGGRIYRFEQNAVNSTSVTQLTTNFNNISAVSNAKPCVTDIDGDGMLDLLVGRADGTIDLYEQETTNPSPTLAGFAPVTTPVCTGQTTTFTATVGNVSPPYAFTLTNGTETITGTANTTAFSQAWTAGGSGTQTFSLIVSGNGTALATTTLTVNVPPSANISAPATEITCTVPNITLTASGGGTYRWDNNTTTATRTVNTAGTYSVTVTGANGCTAVDSQVITSNTTPPIVTIGSAVSVLNCVTTAITLTANGGTSYRWENNTTGQTNNVNVARPHTVTATGANGCTATASKSIASDYTQPTLSLTATNACAGQNVSLRATPGLDNYIFYLPSGQTINAGLTSNTVIAGLTANTYSFSVTARHPTSFCQATATAGATVSPPLTLSLSNNNTCQGTNVVLQSGSGFDSYTLLTPFSGSLSSSNGTYGLNPPISGVFTYSVSAINIQGCRATATIVHTVLPLSVATLTASPSTTISCTNPSLTLTAASTAASQTWSTNATSSSIVVTTGGVYSVTTVSPDGCRSVTSITISVDFQTPTATLTVSPSNTITCANPVLTLTAGGNGSYEFRKNPSSTVLSTGPTLDVSTGGRYTVLVTAPSGCTASAFRDIFVNTTPPSVSLVASGPLTCAQTSITLTATGGNNYLFERSGGEGILSQSPTAGTALVSASGTYSVTVTNAAGCTATGTITVNSNTATPGAQINTPNGTTLTCSTTSLNLVAVGGNSYQWDDNSTMPTRAVSTPGTYSVLVTGSNGCTATVSRTVTSNTAVVTVTNPTTTTGILGLTFSQTFTASGGQGSYSFSVVSGTLPAGMNLFPSGVLIGDPAQPGSFTFIIRARDANGCSGFSPLFTLFVSTTATVSTAAAVNISGISATLGGTVSADGGATVTEFGIVYLAGAGTPTTSNTKVMMGAGVGTYSQLVTGLSPATTYSLRAYAINRAGTSYGNLQTFTTSSAPLAPVVLTPANGSVTGQNRPTYTGTAAPGDVVTVRVDNIIEGQVTADASGNWSITSSSPLPDGPHSVYASVFRDGVLSANSNTNSFTVDTTPPPAPVVTTPANGALLSNNSPTYTGTAEPASTLTVIVDGSTVGTATADASGNWSFAQSTPLAQGSHTLRARATDGAGNTSVDSNTNTFTVDTSAPTVTITSSATDPTPTGPIPLTFTFSESVTGFVVEDITVGNGSLSGFAGSGSTYTANFIPATPGLVSVSVAAGVAQDAASNLNGASNRFTLTYAPLPTIAGLSASPTAICTDNPVTFTATIGNVTGSYAYTLTNGSSTGTGTSSNLSFSQVWQTAGSGVQTFTLTVAGNGRSVATTMVTVNALPVATLSSSGTLTCAQTSVVLTATGGSSYAFSGPGVSQSGSGNTAPVSLPGTYTVVVTNAAGCTATATTTVESATSTVNASLVASGTLTCANPTVTLTASPAGASYTFSGPGLSQSGATNTATVSTAGTYSVTVTAAGGCSAVATVTVQGNTTPPTASIAPTSATLTCTNPTATLTASGGGNYRWEDGSTNAIRSVSSAGTYSVTVTAANGCTATASVTISEDKTLPAVSLSASGTVTCANPTVTLTASPAGQGTYRFTGPGLNQSGAANTATVAAGGVYMVTVTAANGCTASATTTVESATNAVNASLVASGTLTCANPTVTLTASPAGASYTFWGPGLSQSGATNTATVSTAGTYSVTVTAAGGCSAVATVNVQGNTTPPTAGIAPTSATLTCTNPTATLTASGGGSYRWEDGSTNALRTVNSAGTYSVTVTAANGCTASASVMISEDKTPPTVSLAASGTVTCANPTVTLTASPAGQGTYRFTGPGLNQSGTANTATVAAGGVYMVTVTAANGCTASATTTVESATNAVNASLVASGTLTCANPTVTLTASPAGASYTFWGPGLSQSGPGNTATVSTAGTYSVVVTAAGGCSAVATVTVQASQELPTVSISANPGSAITQGQTLTLTASGAATYRWSTGATTPAINPPTSATGSTVYSVTGTGPNGCSATAQITLAVSASVTPPPVSVCGSQPGTLGGPLTLLEPIYNCATGQIQFRTSGGNGSPITYAAIGITGPTTSCSATVDAQVAVDIRDGKPNVEPFTLFATQGNITVSFRWDALAFCAGTPPPANTPPTVANGVGPQSATVGVGYSLNVGNVFTDAQTPASLMLSASGLPAGLSLSGSTITGTPSVSGVSTVTLTATDGGGLSASTSFVITVSGAGGTTPPVGGPLAATVVSYNCQTGAITFGFTGGSGSPVEYLAIGITGWTTNPNQVIEAGLRADPKPVTVQIRQNGVAGRSFVFDFGSFCSGNPQPPTNTAPTVANGVGPQSATVGVGYSLNVGNVFTDAQTPASLMLSASGLPAGLSLSGSTITGTPSVSGVSTVTLTATDGGGLSASTSFVITVIGAGGTTPPVGGPLAATVVSYNCQTGAITFGFTGGNGAAVEYFAIGITGWTTNVNGVIEAGLRADPKPVTIRVRQNGVEGTPFVFDFGQFCSRPARIAAESVSELDVVVLGNPTPDSWVEVLVGNPAGESLHLRVVSAQGRLMSSQAIAPTGQGVRQWVSLGSEAGTYLLQISTPTRTKTVKVVRQ